MQDFVKALGITHIKEDSFEFIDSSDKILQSIKNNHKDKYTELLESIQLEYPSYIFSLAMGSGKTLIITSIIAIEFAIALANENKDSNFNFMKNALVFAPGTTIFKGSLKTISVAPFEKILPPFLLSSFLARVTFTYADNTKKLNIIAKSNLNIVV